MDDRRWSTKEDILKDLAQASGHRLSDVDEGCLVYGERPPPRRICDDEDEEMKLLFGHVTSTGAREAPDLNGITQLIRMVQDQRDDAAESTTRNSTATSTNDVIVISKLNNSPATNQSTPSIQSTKLNPEVKEFVPRTAVSAICLDTNSHQYQPSEPAQRLASPSAEDEAHLIETKDIQQYTERDELAAALRTQIRSAAEEDGDDLHFRRKKYAAIAHLLKLHSTPPEEQIKLRTPDYFKNYKATDRLLPESGTKAETAHDKPIDSEDREQSQSGKRLNSDNRKTTLTPEAEAMSFYTGAKKTNSGRETDGGEPSVPPLSGQDAEGAVADAVEERELKASINKVTRWLYAEPPAQPAPAPAPSPRYLGAIGFKRKEGVAARRGAEAAVSAQPRARTDVTYVPSQYAAELGRQYAERGAAEAARAMAGLSIWERLEADLRMKDEEIRRRGCNAADS